ncbi:DUF3334 family protein [Deltaproteobacteria bacterium TL4]
METSILHISKIFRNAIINIIERSCQFKISASKTAQFVPSIQLSEQIGTFVSFHGNYGGLMVINFSGDAALEIVQASLKTMGMPEEDIPTHYMSDDVRNSLGELVNHIIGKARTDIQVHYELTAQATIPAVVPITTPIGLFFEKVASVDNPCIRLSFYTPGKNRFQMELTMEPSRFVNLP